MKKRAAIEWLIFLSSIFAGAIALIVAEFIYYSGNFIYNDPVENYWFYYLTIPLIIVQITRITKGAIKIVKENKK